MASPEDDVLVDLQVNPSAADGATGTVVEMESLSGHPELWMKWFELYIKRIGVRSLFVDAGGRACINRH